MLAWADRQGYPGVEVPGDSRDGSGRSKAFDAATSSWTSTHTRRRAQADVLPGLLRKAEHRGFAGLNITYPCKQAIIPMLDN